MPFSVRAAEAAHTPCWFLFGESGKKISVSFLFFLSFSLLMHFSSCLTKIDTGHSPLHCQPCSVMHRVLVSEYVGVPLVLVTLRNVKMCAGVRREEERNILSRRYLRRLVSPN